MQAKARAQARALTQLAAGLASLAGADDGALLHALSHAGGPGGADALSGALAQLLQQARPPCSDPSTVVESSHVPSFACSLHALMLACFMLPPACSSACMLLKMPQWGHACAQVRAWAEEQAVQRVLLPVEASVAQLDAKSGRRAQRTTGPPAMQPEPCMPLKILKLFKQA